MWLVDANVLLYAVNRKSMHHEPSRSWLDAALGGSVPVGLAWSALLAFLRLSTHRSVFDSPFTVEEASHQLRRWLLAPATLVLEPTSRHGDVLVGLIAEVGTAGNLVQDAHLAALATEHSATVVTFDTDFLRFAGVRTHRPA